MPPPSSRMTKNRAQPTRYRPGKAEVEDQASEEEEEESEEEDDLAQPSRAPPPKATSFPSQKRLAVDLSRAAQQAKDERTQPAEDLEGFVTASESSSAEEDDGDGSEEDSNSSEEESSSEDDFKKPMLAPKFIPKAKRVQQAAATNAPTNEDRAVEAERLRKEKADALLQAQLERDAAARAAGKKYWDDDDINPEDEVDDTDGLDPDAEQAAWKLRELKRVRRDRLAIEEKEQEKEEIERRRNMTAEEREAEDQAYIEAQQDGKESKGKMGYMQKYFHKGAFFGDAGEEDEEVKAALNRSFAGATFEDETSDKAVLPEYMRIRDMTRLGKKGRTKYKDLKAEDTGRWGQDVGRKKREFEGLDERFQPDERGGFGSDRTGANNAPLGERRPRENENRDGRDEKRARYG